MLNELNHIDLAGWETNPNVSTEIAKAIDKASWKKSVFEPFSGRGGDRGVRTFSVQNNQPYRPRLKAKLQGEGVKGNADFETNFDNFEILSQVIYPKVVGNAILSEIEIYSQIQHIDFIKEAVDSLTDWDADQRDRNLVAALVNDFTNGVVADATNGFKDTTTQKSLTNATKQIIAGDVCNVKMIRRAIFMARTGLNYNGKAAFPIKPIRSETISLGGVPIQNHSYIIMLDSYQIEQIKKDPEWIEMQKIGIRGDKNNLFTGLVGYIDNCPVIDMGVWTALEVGMPSSEVSDTDFLNAMNPQNAQKIVKPSDYADKQSVSIGALIGASALVMAGSSKANFYISRNEDVGRKTICAVDRLMAISKAKFVAESGVTSPYDNMDFGTIGIFSSKE